MTDQPTPLSDEDLSAALDGEAAPEVLERIAADPRAQARQAELAVASAGVGATVAPLDPAVVDQLISGALDAPAADAPPAPARRSSGPPPWLVAAAVALLVAVGLGLIWNGRSTSDERASFDTVGGSIAGGDEEAAGQSSAGDVATETQESTGGAGGEAAPASTTTGPEPDQAADAPLVDLGVHDAPEELRALLATSFTGDETSATSREFGPPDATAVDRCAEQLQVTLGLDAGPTQQGWAIVDDEVVLVYEFAIESFADGSPTTLVAAVGAEACNAVLTFER